ncbi:hypothetical protein HN011_002041 [Eciton burchellii]|nr:hypothetical protein HN011_002041 [Eciton burchellii]
MVMEASPSPQSVGREFVRQYYTLLNQAPAHLHRFYNQHSSFVHGGLDSNRESTPAIGQKQIHQKIQQLNFRDCHAKISQVDSQLTLENGVVVQVSGELSNAGQPMRRFTQTFVLAVQAPKTYYVHNDIFRYQDLMFNDEDEADASGGDGGESGEREVEEIGRTEPEEDEHQSNQVQPLSVPAQAAEQQAQPALIPAQQQPPLQQQQPIAYYAAPPQPHVHSVIQQVLNGTVHEEVINQQPPQQQQQQQQQPSLPPAQPHQYIAEPAAQSQFVQEAELNGSNEQQQQASEPQTATEERNEQPEAETFTASTQEAEPEPHQVANTTVSNSGPKTYANLVKSFPSSSGASTSPQTSKLSISPPPMTNLRLDERSLHPTNNGPTSMSVSNNASATQQQTHRVGGNQPPQQQQHPQQQRVPRGGLVQRDGERRGTRPGQYSDAHQLFLGNLPHNASENDLRQVFERYGRVAELRVHSKSNDRCKGPQGGNNTARVPNYGFITFEDQQVVTKVLNSLPIYYPDESGQKLNVEEKKVRPRMNMDGSGGRLNSGDGGMRSMGGQQQQQQRGPGGPGVMRGGQHGTRGGRGGFSRGGDGSRGGGGMRQPGNPGNPGYQNRR